MNNKLIRKLLPVLALLMAAVITWQQQDHLTGAPTTSLETQTSDRLAKAFSNRESNLQIEGVGTVLRVLPDDTRGSRHQRFLLELASGQSVLVAHNIDLAPRIPNLEPGDQVHFFGEYEWNDRGGVLHWTHHDPRGRHPDGWLRHRGQSYR